MKRNTTYHSELVQEKLSEIEKLVVPIPSSTLPKNVSGFVNPGTQSGEGLRGFYGADSQSDYSEFVKHHELAHAFGIDGSPRGEYLADTYAASRTGNPNLIRGPFYRPPINLN